MKKIVATKAKKVTKKPVKAAKPASSSSDSSSEEEAPAPKVTPKSKLVFSSTSGRCIR